MDNAGRAGRLRRTCAALYVAFVALLVSHPAVASGFVVVAIGGSNTAGEGVGRDNAYPAKLQELLRARGYDVRVLNAGQAEDSSRGMLERLNLSIPPKSDIVIVEHGGLNAPPDLKRKEHLDNMAMIDLRLGLRGIEVIQMEQVLAGITRDNIQDDAVHLNESGHRVIAERLVHRVIDAIERINAKRRAAPEGEGASSATK